jgi:hypothetical protein
MADHDGAPNSIQQPSIQPTDPVLCAANCGFFGTPDKLSLCSKCYREKEEKEARAAAQEVDATSASAVPIVNDVLPAVLAAMPSREATAVTEAPSEASSTTEVAKKIKQNRCNVGSCKKKLRLAQQFKCRCEMVFCGTHRYPDAHECEFDHKQHNQDILRKANPVVSASKIDKI